MKSVWSDTSKRPCFESLDQEINTDVLIIGGGMAGINCAYMLKAAGVECVLVEADVIGSGATKNTTAKITVQHGLIYDDLITKFGAPKAQTYLDANRMALGKYRQLCENIDCDFEEKDSFVYTLNDTDKIEKERRALLSLGYPAEVTNEIPLPLEIAGAIKCSHQAQFNPLKFIAAMAENLCIYEHTPVFEIDGHTAMTGGGKGKITAKKIIVASHFPFLKWSGAYFLKMFQHRSYVIALENAPDVQGMYVDEAQTGYSFRNYNDLLLIGGGAHRTGKLGGGWAELEAFAGENYPDAPIKYHWAAQDCMTLDDVPYIGAYSRHSPDIYVASGFNKWGMTNSMVAAMLLTDGICGKENEFAPVFSPSRSILHPQLAVNAFEASANLLMISPKRCTHMGCALKWNAAEHTWDCPCHGSRFTQEGTLIDGPTMKNMR